jgi:diguanylate cyclase (GGDEF)-like protein/PAS domain S-box-containing protein
MKTAALEQPAPVEHPLEHQPACAWDDSVPQSLDILLQAMIESLPEGIVVVDQQRGKVSFNSRFKLIWGLSEENIELLNTRKRFLALLRRVKNPEKFIQRTRELYSNPMAEAHDLIELNDSRIIERYGTPYQVGQAIVGRLWSFRDVTNRERDAQELRGSRAHLKAIFDNAAIGICLLNINGRYMKVNDHWAEMLGYTRTEVYHVTHLEVTHPHDVAVSQERFHALVQGNLHFYRLESRFMRKDGTVFWGDLSVRASYNDQGDLEAIIAIIMDITERKQAEEQLVQWVNELEQRNREATLLNEMSDLLQNCSTVQEAYDVIRHIGTHLFSNQPGILYVFNASRTQLEAVASWGIPPPATGMLEPESCMALRQKWAFVGGNVPLATRCTLTKTPNSCVSANVPYVCVPLVGRDDTLGVLHVRVGRLTRRKEIERWERVAETTARHIALALTNIQLREQLHYQSIRDSLTSLFNRRYLDDALEREVSKAIRHDTLFGIIMLDIDHFKNFNDTYGHDGGDALLRVLGAFLKKNIRNEDIVCRYGGEEFVLILAGASLEDTRRRAEDLRTKAKQLRVRHHGYTMGCITISLGVATFPDHGLTPSALLRAADSALYRAKKLGRDRIVLAESLD